jgi:hypothetical protein
VSGVIGLWSLAIQTKALLALSSNISQAEKKEDAIGNFRGVTRFSSPLSTTYEHTDDACTASDIVASSASNFGILEQSLTLVSTGRMKS